MTASSQHWRTTGASASAAEPVIPLFVDMAALRATDDAAEIREEIERIQEQNTANTRDLLNQNEQLTQQVAGNEWQRALML